MTEDITLFGDKRLTYQACMEGAQTGIAVGRLDGDLGILWANGAFCTARGYIREQIRTELGNKGILLVYGQDRGKVRENLFRAAEERRPSTELEFRVVKRDGTVIRTASQVTFFYFEAETALCFYDVNGYFLRSDSVAEGSVSPSADLLYRQELRYREATANNALAFYEVDLERDEILDSMKGRHADFMNDVGLSGGGCLYSEFLARWGENKVHPADRDYYFEQLGTDRLLSRFQEGYGETRCEYRNQKKDQNAYFWVEAVVHVIWNPARSSAFAFVCVNDVDKKKQMELSLLEKAERDSLTGLYNRETFISLTEKALRQEHPTEEKCALMILDVDNFKDINDAFGHLEGDRVLAQIALKLKEAFRQSDLTGRLGGDEFLIFADHLGSSEQAKAMAHRTCSALNLSFFSAGKRYTTSSSVGLVILPRKSADFQTLYQKADQALYQAKQRGKNRYAIYRDPKEPGSFGPEESESPSFSGAGKLEFGKILDDDQEIQRKRKEYSRKLNGQSADVIIKEFLEMEQEHHREIWKYAMLLRATQDILFECDLRRDDFKAYCDWAKVFGVIPENYQAVLKQFYQSCHPEDQQAFWKTFQMENLQKAVDAGADKLTLEFRVKFPEAGYQWLRSTLVPFETERGKIVSVVACAQILGAESLSKSTT